MNFRLRQERNAFVLLVVVALPMLLLTAPLPYLSALMTSHAQQAGNAKAVRAHQTKAQTKPKPPTQARS